MNSRYFVICRRVADGTPQTKQFAFGSFSGQQAAEAAAREQFNKGGLTVEAVRPETGSEATVYALKRFLIRGLRIAFGISVALVAYAFLWDSYPALGSTPFGQLTLDVVFGRLSSVALLIGVLWLAWVSAFGKGPSCGLGLAGQKIEKLFLNDTSVGLSVTLFILATVLLIRFLIFA